MLSRLVSMGVAVAVALGGGAVAMEALGLMRSGATDTGPRRLEAIIAYIEAHFDPRDLPSEGEDAGLWPPADAGAEDKGKAPTEEQPGGKPVASAKVANDARPLRTAVGIGPDTEPEDEPGPLPDAKPIPEPDTEPETEPAGGPKGEPAGLAPAPKPAAGAKTATITPVPAPVRDTKACVGDCTGKRPGRTAVRRGAGLAQASSDAVTCPLWGGSAAPGKAAFCPVALLP